MDTHGNIYCDPVNFSRLQVYDRSGTFLRGWFVPSASGLFATRVHPNGQVEVATSRGEHHLLYSSQGELVWKKIDDTFYQNLMAARSPMKRDLPRRYGRVGGILSTNVWRMRDDGTWETVVRSPVFKGFFIGLPVWFFYLFFGLITLNLAQKTDSKTVDSILGLKIRRRYSRTRNPPTRKSEDMPGRSS